jgi:hypothetical protein
VRYIGEFTPSITENATRLLAADIQQITCHPKKVEIVSARRLDGLAATVRDLIHAIYAQVPSVVTHKFEQDTPTSPK